MENKKNNVIRQSNEYKSLVRTYFIEQKVKEIGMGLFGILGLIFIPYLIGLSFPERWRFIFFDYNVYVGTIYQIWWIGLTVIILFLISCGILFAIGWLFYRLADDWITSNLEKARDRADEELNIMERY